jgi:glutamate dehydrogenase
MTVTLPNGDIVDNGLTFRNNFHTNPLACSTLFVPCGGRPESLDLDNVNALIRPDGTSLFRFIVEGANLFLTQDARLRLENHGVVVFKDASANKGGVTSSSLEVLAALAFTDDEFEQHMCIKLGHPAPAFYEHYVEQLQQTIEQNARVEFEALWREHKKTNMPISLLSDNMSTAIVQLNEQLQHSGLWDNVELRHTVLTKAFPRLLLEKVGLEALIARVPENYVKAIFGAYLASQFVYKYGPHPDHFAFFDFMRENYYAEAG